MSFIESQNQTFTYPELKEARAEFWDPPFQNDSVTREGSSSWVRTPLPTDYISLDEVCAIEASLDLPGMPIITEILPEAIATESDGHTTIFLLDQTKDEKMENSLEVVNSAREDRSKHRSNDQSLSSKLFPDHTDIPSSGPVGPIDWTTSSGPSESRKLAKETFPEFDISNDDIGEIDGTPDSLLKAYNAPSKEPPTPKDRNRHTDVPTKKVKRPSKLKQVLFKSRYVFEGSYYEHFGNEVPRMAIIKGGVRYARTIEREKPARRNRTAAVAGGIALAAVVFAAGVGAGIHMSGNESESPKQQTPTEHVSNFATTTSIYKNQTEQILSMTSEQAQAYHQFLTWVDENPDKDFVEEFQKAQQAGYFS